jgi:hypothetical protein
MGRGARSRGFETPRGPHVGPCVLSLPLPPSWMLTKDFHKGVWPRCRLQSHAGKSVCKGWEYPLLLYVQSFIRKRARGLITCCVVRLWPRVKSNAGSPDVERCKHVKSQATTVYFRLGKLRRVSTYVQHVWGIIGHVTAEAGNTVGTDGAPPQDFIKGNVAAGF